MIASRQSYPWKGNSHPLLKVSGFCWTCFGFNSKRNQGGPTGNSVEQRASLFSTSLWSQFIMPIVNFNVFILFAFSSFLEVTFQNTCYGGYIWPRNKRFFSDSSIDGWVETGVYSGKWHHHLTIHVIWDEADKFGTFYFFALSGWALTAPNNLKTLCQVILCWMDILKEFSLHLHWVILRRWNHVVQRFCLIFVTSLDYK